MREHSRRASSARTDGLRAFVEILETRRLFTAGTFRVVTYNVNADTSDYSSVNQSANLETVLEGIGGTSLSDNGKSNAQAVDVLGVEELQNSLGGPNAPTLATIVSNLNTKYGSGTYAYDTTADPTTGTSTGNGPSGLVYNAKTLSVVSAKALGTVSSSGEARAPMEYKLQPVGYASTAAFYVIVSHMKSASDSTSISRRNAEAQVITSEITNLGSSAHVIVMGDLNITGGSAESTYTTLTSKVDDVAHPTGTWADNTVANAQGIAKLLSDATNSVHYRDDMELVSPSADPASSSVAAGFQYAAGSSTVFGNSGATTIVSHAVNDTTNNPSSLSTTLLNALFNTTDHLPVVADYSLVGLGGSSSGPALTWNVSGQTGFGTQGLAATTVASGVTNSTGLTRGSGVTTSGTAASNAWGGTNWASTSSAGISGNENITFGATVSSSHTLSLSAIDMNYRRSSTGPSSGFWQYEIGTGAWTNIADVGSEFSSTSSSGAAMSELSLSGISALQNLAAGTKVTFRLTPYGATSTSGTFYVYNVSGSDLVVKGTIGSTGTQMATATKSTTTTSSSTSLFSTKTIDQDVLYS